jgi:hypothetical protein
MQRESPCLLSCFGSASASLTPAAEHGPFAREAVWRGADLLGRFAALRFATLQAIIIILPDEILSDTDIHVCLV